LGTNREIQQLLE